MPKKPTRSPHTHQSEVVASEAANKYDNPHFDISVSRTKGLLEDIQVAMDYTDISTTATENPSLSTTENSQTPTTYTVKNEGTSPTKSKYCSPLITYSTPGELEKLQTGTFSLPRTTGPIKTPRRKVAAVTKFPANNNNNSNNKGIPTPAPCKPTTADNVEELTPQ